MVSLAIVLGMIAAQPAVAETAEVPVCTMTTPRGDNVRFFLWGDPAPDRMRMSALPGSAWPNGTVVGTRRQGGAGSNFVLGGPDGMLLELSNQGQGRAQRAVTLFSRQGERENLPIAYGYCQDEQVTANPPEPGPDQGLVGADNAAFDPERWPDRDCSLLLSNGRRVTLDPELRPNDRLELRSSDLWGGRPVNTRIRWADRVGVQVGSFGDPDSPQGVRVLAVSGTRATVLFRFQDLKDPSLAGVSAYGICGIRRIERRPNR